MTSRIESHARQQHARCGPSRTRCRRAAAAPNSNASSRKPNFSCASSAVDAHHREHPLLHVAAVDTDRAAADLVAVADDVVGVGQRRARVGLEAVDPLRLRRGEGVVHGRPGAGADRDVAGCVAFAGGSNSGASTTHTNAHADSSISPQRRPISSRAAPSSARDGVGVAGGEEDAVARLRRRRARPGPSRSASERFLATGPPSSPSSPTSTYARPAAPRCLAHSCQASSVLARLDAPPGMTTAPTYGAWNTRNGVSAK